MSFFQAIRAVFSQYAEFGGRARRSEFWWFALFSALVTSALNALSVPMSAGLSSRMFELGDNGGYGYGTSYVSFAGVWGIIVLLPSLAVTIRRLRDAGRRWTELWWLLLPIAGVIILIVHLCEPSVPTPIDSAAPTVTEPAPAPAP